MVGLARAGDKYPVLGVTETVVEKALYQAQAFWAKGVELQQVIDESMKNFKAFFRWVYVEILKLSEETVSGDLSKVSQQDITFIAEFLKRFQPVESTGGSVSHLYLEKVGQYLEDAPLVQPPDNSANPWHQLLEKHPEIQEVPFIIPVNTGTSLVQEHAKLEAAVSQVGIFRFLLRALYVTNRRLAQSNSTSLFLSILCLATYIFTTRYSPG